MVRPALHTLWEAAGAAKTFTHPLDPELELDLVLHGHSAERVQVIARRAEFPQ